VNLHQADCELPETGWGRLHLTRTTPEVGKRYTDSGELHDDKGLKHRPGSSTYTQVWRAARAFALALEQARSPLAGRPYDLRHAAASLWLNAGVPAPTSPAGPVTAWMCSCASTLTASTATRR